MMVKKKYKYLSVQGHNKDTALSATVSIEHNNYTLPATAKTTNAEDTEYLRYTCVKLHY